MSANTKTQARTQKPQNLIFPSGFVLIHYGTGYTTNKNLYFYPPPNQPNCPLSDVNNIPENPTNSMNDPPNTTTSTYPIPDSLNPQFGAQ